MMEKRNYNIDLFRIVIMLMIVGLHYLQHGGVLKSASDNSNVWYLSNFIFALFIVSVNSFVLITGYFVGDKSFNYKRLLRLIGRVVFYSVVIYVVSVIFGFEKFSLKKMIISFFPIITGRYWFISSYILLYILSPYINILINNISKKMFEYFILILTIFSSIIPTIRNSGEGILLFICLYCLGVYIKRYINIEKIISLKLFFSLVGLCCL